MNTLTTNSANSKPTSKTYADAEIDDAISESAAVQVLLQEVGETLPGVEAEAGGDAVAEADDSAPRVGGGGRRGGRGGGWRRGAWGGCVRLATTTQKRQGDDQADSEHLRSE